MAVLALWSSKLSETFWKPFGEKANQKFPASNRDRLANSRRDVASCYLAGEFRPDDRHFVLITHDDDTTTLRFGDGKHGSRLPTGDDRIVATYRTSKRFVAVVQQQGRVIVDKDWSESDPTVSYHVILSRFEAV